MWTMVMVLKWGQHLQYQEARYHLICVKLYCYFPAVVRCSGKNNAEMYKCGYTAVSDSSWGQAAVIIQSPEQSEPVNISVFFSGHVDKYERQSTIKISANILSTGDWTVSLSWHYSYWHLDVNILHLVSKIKVVPMLWEMGMLSCKSVRP